MPLSAPKVRKEIDQQWGSWTSDLEQWPQGKGNRPSHLGGLGMQKTGRTNFRPVLNIRAGLKDLVVGRSAPGELFQVSCPKVPNRRRQMHLTP